jgi:hypothetical protein
MVRTPSHIFPDIDVDRKKYQLLDEIATMVFPY